jgi:hypothetical protein
MPRIRRHRQENLTREQIAEATRWRLFLSAICFVLALRVGEGVWPLWIIDYRKQIMGVVLLILVFLTLLSPLIVEVNSNPRTLSGPGKDPRQGWYP